MNAITILERDHWRCQLCGIETPRSLRGTTHPHAPEIGHIIPRCRGGDDSPENLRCECGTCNRRKGGLLDGELAAVFTPSGIPEDYVAIFCATEAQREGGRLGGRIAIRKMTREAKVRGGHNCPREACVRGARNQSREAKVHAGRIGSRISNKRHVGTLEQKTWSSRGARNQPREAKVRAGRTGMHTRYHLNRGIINPNCNLCCPPRVEVTA